MFHLVQNDAQLGAFTLGLLLLALCAHQGPCCHPACHKHFSQAGGPPDVIGTDVVRSEVI